MIGILPKILSEHLIRSVWSRWEFDSKCCKFMSFFNRKFLKPLKIKQKTKFKISGYMMRIGLFISRHCFRDEQKKITLMISKNRESNNNTYYIGMDWARSQDYSIINNVVIGSSHITQTDRIIHGS